MSKPTETSLERRERKANLVKKFAELHHEDTIAIRLRTGEKRRTLFDFMRLRHATVTIKRKEGK